MYKFINNHSVKRRKVEKSDYKHTKIKEVLKMKDFRKVFKIGGFTFSVTGDYTKDKPEKCKRVGRIDIPLVKGYFYVLFLISYRRWFFRREYEKCIYWEV